MGGPKPAPTFELQAGSCLWAVGMVQWDWSDTYAVF